MACVARPAKPGVRESVVAGCRGEKGRVGGSRPQRLKPRRPGATASGQRMPTAFIFEDSREEIPPVEGEAGNRTDFCSTPSNRWFLVLNSSTKFGEALSLLSYLVSGAGSNPAVPGSSEGSPLALQSPSANVFPSLGAWERASLVRHSRLSPLSFRNNSNMSSRKEREKKISPS